MYACLTCSRMAHGCGENRRLLYYKKTVSWIEYQTQIVSKIGLGCLVDMTMQSDLTLFVFWQAAYPHKTHELVRLIIACGCFLKVGHVSIRYKLHAHRMITGGNERPSDLKATACT